MFPKKPSLSKWQIQFERLRWESFRSAEYEIGLGELDNRSELTSDGIAFSAKGL